PPTTLTSRRFHSPRQFFMSQQGFLPDGPWPSSPRRGFVPPRTPGERHSRNDFTPQSHPTRALPGTSEIGRVDEEPALFPALATLMLYAHWVDAALYAASSLRAASLCRDNTHHRGGHHHLYLGTQAPRKLFACRVEP